MMPDERPELLVLRQVAITFVVLVVLTSGAAIGTRWSGAEIRTLDQRLSEFHGPVRDILVRIEDELQGLEDEIFWRNSDWEEGLISDEAFRNRIDQARNLQFGIIAGLIAEIERLNSSENERWRPIGDQLSGEWQRYTETIGELDPAIHDMPEQVQVSGDRFRQAVVQQARLNQIDQTRARDVLARDREQARRRQTILVALVGIVGVATFGWSARIIRRSLRAEREARLTLRASEERFALAVDATGEGLWDCDIATGEAYLSDRWCALLGYRPAELEPGIRTWKTHLHPDEKAWVLAGLDRSLERREPFDIEHRLRTKSGTYRWFRCRGKGVWDREGKPIRMVGSISDVTEVRNATDALVKSEERYRQLFDLAQEGIWVLDADDRTLFVNPSMTHILGYAEDEMIGRDLLSFVAPADRGAVEKTWKNPRQGPSAICEISMIRKDQKRVYVQIDTSPIDYGSGRGTIVGVADITARRLAELSLRQRLNIEEILSDISSSLINVAVDRIDDVIEKSLKRVGEYFRADHARLLVFSPNRQEVTLTHLWSRTGEGDDLDGRAFRVAHRPGVTGTLLEGRPATEMMERRSDNTDPEPGTLESFGCRTVVRVPISFEQNVIGYMALGFLNVHEGSNEEVDVLRNVGQVFSNALNRQRDERRLRSALDEVSRLKERLEAENVYLQEEVRMGKGFSELIGQEKNFLDCVALVETAAPTRVPVLITGETGCGKELFARALHELSPRKNRPLISVNCAALPPSLIESELFGHEKGAFTGADRQRKGRFEIADGSTLFLDEIGDLPIDLQGKLLRVIQEGKVERLGSSAPIDIDVRIVTATNRNLRRAVELGEFRADLFYRINTFPVHLPPLRERPGDIPILAKHFVRKHAPRLGRKVQLVSSATLAELKLRAWPGNVRELEHFIERALISSPGSILEISAFSQGDEFPAGPEPLRSAREPQPGGSPADPTGLAEFERRHIVASLETAAWVIEGERGAAEALGVAPSTLRSKMKRLGIRRPRAVTRHG